jgi:hypothetical protein
MVEPTNDLMLKVLLELREEMATFRSDLAALDAKFDRMGERYDILTLRVDEGFADLRVAIRNAGKLSAAVDRDNLDLASRVVALEQRVALLEKQD